MDWQSFIQGVAGTYANARIDAKYRQPYDIQKLRLAALGEAGYYEEGQPGVSQVAPKPLIPGVSNTVLLLGVVAVVVVLMVND